MWHLRPYSAWEPTRNKEGTPPCDWIMGIAKQYTKQTMYVYIYIYIVKLMLYSKQCLRYIDRTIKSFTFNPPSIHLPSSSLLCAYLQRWCMTTPFRFCFYEACCFPFNLDLYHLFMGLQLGWPQLKSTNWPAAFLLTYWIVFWSRRRSVGYMSTTLQLMPFVLVEKNHDKEIDLVWQFYIYAIDLLNE